MPEGDGGWAVSFLASLQPLQKCNVDPGPLSGPSRCRSRGALAVLIAEAEAKQDQAKTEDLPVTDRREDGPSAAPSAAALLPPGCREMLGLCPCLGSAERGGYPFESIAYRAGAGYTVSPVPSA